jgi:RHS repeat-associated protein
VNVVGRRTNVLPYTIWMPKLDMANVVTFSSPTSSEVVLRTPKIPGLEIHLEPGTVLEDRDGRPVKQLGITPIPPDQPPFPLPEPFAMYFTIQPGGVSLTRGARAVYPNLENDAEGKSWDFWSHEPEGGIGWYRYGKGRVRPGRKHVDPDPDTRIYKITVHGCCPLGSSVATGPAPGSPSGADPVNFSSGLFVHEKTDLVIPDVIPIVIQRTYQPGDGAVRDFGVGTNHLYGMTLARVGAAYFGWQEANLFLPDGGRIHFQLIQSGPNWPLDWAWEHRETPTAFFKARLAMDPASLLMHVTLRDGTKYVFEGHTGRLLEQRDRYGNRLIISRHQTSGPEDVQGALITRVTSPNGRTVDFVYDNDNRIGQVIDQLGRTVTYNYDASSRLVKVTDPAGGATEYTYDAAGRMATIKDPRGIVWLTNEYYTTGVDTGRVKKQTLANGSSTYQLTYTNDAQGRITQTDLTDPRGVVRRLTFNTAGYALTDTFALGLPEAQAITYEPDTNPTKGNLVRAVTDALGRRTEYDYDTYGNVTQIRRLAGTADQITSTMTYEPCFFDTPAGFCRPTAVTSSTATTDGRVTVSYSGLTQAIITDPRGQPTTISYNAAGLPTQVLTPLGAPPVQYGYTGGLLTSVTDRLGRVTTRAYDGGGRLVSQTDPSGRTTSSSYSPLNQLTAVAAADGGGTRFTYDPNGNLLTVKDAKGNTTTYAYDVLDRVQQRTDPLGKSETFQYDGNDNLTQHTDRKNQVTTFSYDGLNRLTGTTGVGYTVTRTWDAGNRLTQMVDSVGGTITNAWDVLDRLTTETTALGVVRYDNPTNPADRGYDTLGRRLWMEVPGQARVTYTWDAASRLTQLQQGSQIASFAYDNANRRTLLTLPNGANTEYQYDLASRVTALIYRNAAATELGRLAYGYDPVGNRTRLGESFAGTLFPSAVTEASYNAGNRQTAFGSQVLAYDDNGNLTSITQGTDITALTWDSRNRLTALSTPTTAATFSYDAASRRSAKTIDGTTTQFQYDGLEMVRDVVGSTATGYLNGPGIDEPLARGGAEFYWADALGSVLRLTDAGGAIATAYGYEPFGRASVTSGASTNSAQYTGREVDGTGLYYYRVRYYHPQLQRFISEDPIGFAGGDTNLYTYVGNSPTGLIDPLGLDAWSDAGNLAAGFGDTISLGGTAWIRSLWLGQFGLPDTVDQSSGWNLAGRKAGQAYNAISAVVGGVGALRAAAASGRGLAAASRAAFRAAEEVSSFRVPLKHLPGAGGNWAKFAEGVDPHGAIAQALRSAGARFLPNSETSFKVIADLGTAVGSKGQTGVRVIVDFTGRIISAFPVHP